MGVKTEAAGTMGSILREVKPSAPWRGKTTEKESVRQKKIWVRRMAKKGGWIWLVHFHPWDAPFLEVAWADKPTSAID